MTLKRWLILIILILGIILVYQVAVRAQGASQRFYGPNGQSLGTSTTIGNTTTFYGANGAKEGSATTTRGATTFYGPQGQVVGHSYGRGR